MGLVRREVSWLEVQVGVFGQSGVVEPGEGDGLTTPCLAAAIMTGLNAEGLLDWRGFFVANRGTEEMAGREVG
jgi:hypothetical protein